MIGIASFPVGGGIDGVHIDRFRGGSQCPYVVRRIRRADNGPSRKAWQWALAHRAGDGPLPSGSEMARQAGGSGRQAYTHFFDTVTWLAPTAAHLALLNEPVPAGFAKISEQQLAQQ